MGMTRHWWTPCLAWAAMIGASSMAMPALKQASARLQCDSADPQSSYCRGEAHFNDTILEGLEANGRSCATCHVPSEAFQLSPETVERRYAALLVARSRDLAADDPLFRPIDADDFRIKGDAASTYSNLRRGLIRVAIPLPANLRLIDQRTDLPSSETEADVWRAVPSILNVAISGADGVEPAWRLGPNPNGASTACKPKRRPRCSPMAGQSDCPTPAGSRKSRLLRAPSSRPKGFDAWCWR